MNKEELKIWIRDNLFVKTGYQLNSSRLMHSDYYYKNIEYYEIIDSFTKFIDKDNILEKVYCIMNDVDSRPLCGCGSDVSFLTVNKGYRKYCSKCKVRTKYSNKSIKIADISDDELKTFLKSLYTNENKLNSAKTDINGKFYNENKEIFNLLDSKLDMKDELLRVKIPSYLTNIYEIPKCYCGNNVKFDSGKRKWNIFCSDICSNKPEGVKILFKDKIKVHKEVNLSKEELKAWVIDNLLLEDSSISTSLFINNCSFYYDNYYMFEYIDEQVKIDNITTIQKCYCVLKDIYENPKCYCGNNVNYSGSGKFNIYCSHKCAKNHPDFKFKINECWNNRTKEEVNEIVARCKDTKLEKYGDENYNNAQQIQETIKSYGEEFQKIRFQKAVETKYNDIDENGLNGFDRGILKLKIAWSNKTNEEVDLINNKRRKTILKRYKVKHHLQLKHILQKSKSTRLERYGNENYNNSEKAVETGIKNGNILPRELKDDFIHYCDLVYTLSNTNYGMYYDYINPTNIKRGFEFHLDHIYSKRDGFKNNIPIWIVSHPCNLQMLKGTENMSKNFNSHHSLEELMNKIEEFEKRN